MMNMGYCRFENTHLALDECLEAIDRDCIQSEREVRHGLRMFTTFLEFCQENDIIDDFDEENLEYLITLSEDEDEE